MVKATFLLVLFYVFLDKYLICSLYLHHIFSRTNDIIINCVRRPHGGTGPLNGDSAGRDELGTTRNIILSVKEDS